MSLDTAITIGFFDPKKAIAAQTQRVTTASVTYHLSMLTTLQRLIIIVGVVYFGTGWALCQGMTAAELCMNFWGKEF